MRYDIDGQLAVITFDRPEVLNAFRAVDVEELHGLLDRAEADADVRVLVLTGTGRAFCAGEDLNELSDLLSDSALTEAKRRLDRLQHLTRRMVGLGKPIVAVLNGVAVGLGAELAVACDLRVAAESARIGFVEPVRAQFMTNGVMWLLPRIVGHGHAARMLLSGEIYGARRCLDIGLVSDVLPDEGFLDGALALARTIATNAPITVRNTKEVLRRSPDLDLETVMSLEIEGLLECARSQDAREGTAAFLERRPPHYRGV